MSKNYACFLPLLLLLLLPSMTFAQEGDASQAEEIVEEAIADVQEEVEEPAWTGSLGLSYLSASGNSETESLGAEFDLHRRPEPWGFGVKARFHRAEENSRETAERYFAGIRAERSLSDRWSLFGGLNGERDEYAGFELRAILEAGALYKALLGPVHELTFETGLTYTEEEFIDNTEIDYLGALLGLAYAWQINEGTKFSQAFVYHPNFDVSDNWRWTSETALVSDLNDRLALKLGYHVRYDNQPAVNAEKRDTSTTASVVMNF